MSEQIAPEYSLPKDEVFAFALDHKQGTFAHAKVHSHRQEVLTQKT